MVKKNLDGERELWDSRDMERETNNNMTDLENEARSVIIGFMARFPSPDCREQQEIVEAAEQWLRSYEVEQENNNAFWSRFRSVMQARREASWGVVENGGLRHD